MAQGEYTPRNFEDEVADILKEECEKLKLGWEVGVRQCVRCNGECCCKRKVWACPDIALYSWSGAKKKYKTIVDCKRYQSGGYISGEDVEKLIDDKKVAKAKLGVIVTSEGEISEANHKLLEQNNCRFVEVGEYAKKKHWKHRLRTQFYLFQ